MEAHGSQHRVEFVLSVLWIDLVYLRAPKHQNVASASDPCDASEAVA